MPNVPAHPIDAVDTDGNATLDAPLYTAKTIRQTSSVDLGGATTTRPLGARTGVRPGTSTSTVTATATTWTVKPHAGVIDLHANTAAGPYRYAVTEDISGAVTPASGSGPRVDIIYAQINDPAETDGTPSNVAGHVRIDYLPGTGGSATPPTTPARAFVLAYIDVPVPGGGTPTVRWVAPYLSAPGGPVWVPNRAALLALPGGTTAEPVWAMQLDTGALHVHRGTSWRQVTGDTFTKNVVVQLPTNGNGDCTWTFPSPFPNGIINAVAIPARTAGLGGVFCEYLPASSSATQASFRIYVTTSLALASSSGVFLSIIATGY